MKGISMRRSRGKAVLAVVLALSLLGGCGKKESASKAEVTGETSVDLVHDQAVLNKIDEINGIIDKEFYFETDRATQEEAIYDGIMAGLDDPYSRYYTNVEIADLMEDTSGKYVGIGAVVTQMQDFSVVVVRPIKQSPAEEAGLKPEDVILEVDDMVITDQGLEMVVEKIRGSENTTAHLKVYRPSTKEELEFDIPRREVENYSVDYEMLEGDIGYISISTFSEITFDEFKEAIDDLNAKGVKAYIFDLRDNGGGLVSAVVKVCDYVMNDGVIVSTKDKNGNVTSEHKDTEQHSVDVPIVMLVNGYSASASEIMAGALKDSGKAVLVGTKTFGKGIVQSIIPLSDGSAIKITIAKYFTPSGYDLHEKGIEPDYEVKLPDDRESAAGLSREEDPQFKKALELLTEK